MPPIVIAILAGGRSIRMGFDKLAVKLDGRSLLDRTIDAAAQTGRPVVVVGRSAHNGRDSVAFIDDNEPGQGPLAGLATALSFATPAPVLALAADMPYITVQAIEWLMDAWEAAGDCDGVVVRNQGMLEPLFSVYTQRVVRDATRRIATGQRSMQRLIEAGVFEYIDAPDRVVAALYNMNEPGDWQQVRAKIEGP